MSVYVDPLFSTEGLPIAPGGKWPYSRACHLTADTHDELVQFADNLGLKAQWIQYAGKPIEHFDLTPNKRAQAVRQGAVELTVREAVDKMRAAIGDYRMSRRRNSRPSFPYVSEKQYMDDMEKVAMNDNNLIGAVRTNRRIIVLTAELQGPLAEESARKEVLNNFGGAIAQVAAQGGQIGMRMSMCIVAEQHDPNRPWKPETDVTVAREILH